MAHTDICKTEMCREIDRRKKEAGGVRPAIRAVSKEYEIPVGTLKRWYYPEGSPNNGTLNKYAKSLIPEPGKVTTVLFETSDGVRSLLTVGPGARPQTIFPIFFRGFNKEKMVTSKCRDKYIPTRCLWAFLEKVGVNPKTEINRASFDKKEALEEKNQR